MSGAHPPLRPFSRGEVPAPTGLESVELDRRAIVDLGVPQPVLMENAGRSAAGVLHRLYPEGPVAVVVGAGNNGGDALVLMRTLAAWGREVQGVLVADRPREGPLLHGWPLPLPIDRDLDDTGWTSLLASASVVVDGVLGTGVRGAPRERQAEAIDRINAVAHAVLSLDVPSGVDAGTGATPGAAARADVTVSFGAPKLGTLLHPARALAGRLVAVEIGFPPWPVDEMAPEVGAYVVTPEWARARMPTRGTDTHKKAVGSVLVVAGRVGMAGAALLAGRAAFRAGAGLVRVCSDPQNRETLQSALPEAIYVDATDVGAVRDALEHSDALAVGPGLGTDGAAQALSSLTVAAPGPPTVLDADALNVAAAGGLDLASVAGERPLLITPHPGEMRRLLAADPADRHPLEAARSAAERFGCAVVLKGAPSLVAAPGAALLVDSQTSSDLAVAGMGDALTGVCGALLAQGLAPREAGAVGLYCTGRAARLAGRGVGLVPSDVIRWLPDALHERGDPRTDLDLPFVTFDADRAG